MPKTFRHRGSIAWLLEEDQVALRRDAIRVALMHRPSLRLGASALLILAVTTPEAIAQPSTVLAQRIEAQLVKASPGTRFGFVVTRDDATELITINPDARFIPASNTKIFTTAAAFAMLNALDQPDAAGGTRVRLEQHRSLVPDVILEGRGDARMSSAPDCITDCLATLADAVAAATHAVHDVVGDDSMFPDQRWSPGMSWNNIPTRSGTATSALTLDNNELPMTVTPTRVGEPPKLDLFPYYIIDNRALTVATSATSLDFDRAPNGFTIRLTGTIATDAKPQRVVFGIDDPAHYAAWRLRAMLEARGVRVTGRPVVHHRPLTPADDPVIRNGTPAARPPLVPALAVLIPPSLLEDLAIINKTSQNLHAELMLRRLGAQTGSGSIADGVAVLRTMLDRAGVDRRHYSFSDGGGMSTYNRIAPRGVVRLLQWIAIQPWGPAWRATLPVGGKGMLERRFAGTTLSGKIFAKTGTLNATSALSGYMIAKSGRTLTFSAIANDIPDGDHASSAVDAALIMIADAN